MRNIITKNRKLFLEELRSGKYRKGCIKSDEKGRPIITSTKDDDGYCVCAIMFHLFPFKGKENLLHARKSLGITGKDCYYIQNTLNDSPLTFPQIADRIENQIFK